MIRRLVLASVLVLSPAAAWSQGFCYRPPQPYPFRVSPDDREFYAFVNDEYQRYMLAMEQYLRCLNAEQASAFQEVEQVMDRWIEYFGDDAAIRVDPDRR